MPSTKKFKKVVEWDIDKQAYKGLFICSIVISVMSLYAAWGSFGYALFSMIIWYMILFLICIPQHRKVHFREIKDAK